MTIIKICGITRLEDARCAAAAGADIVGFIFYPKSPRYLTPERAGAIAGALRSEFGTDAPRSAGVFVDAPPATIRTTVERAALDLVQLHGAEPPALVRALHPCAFKALRPRTMEEARRSYRTYANVARALPATHPNLLLDAHHPYQKGGTGRQADLAVARWLASRCRLLLAGGLAPENVADVVAQIRPWGVDVSSGVESSKGIKDHARVRALIEAVRTYDQSLNRQLPATENRC